MFFARFLRSVLICLSCLGISQSLQGMSYLRSIAANVYAFYSRSAYGTGAPDPVILENELQYPQVNNLPLQTQCHLQNNAKILTSGLVRKYLETPELKNLWEAINDKEYQLHKDYYTFVHGQKNQLYWPEKLYTFLWGQRYKKPVKDFFFAHVKTSLDPFDDDEFMEQETHRVLLLNNKEHIHKESVYKRILFMNYALFANDGKYGNNSAYLISQNFSWNHSGIFLKASTAFELLGYNDIYKEFADQIDRLGLEYQNLSNFGNALLIAIPKQDIHHYVFLTDDKGRRKSIEIEGIGITDDIKTIMEVAIKNPEKLKNSDVLQFGLVMFHKNGGLDPEIGIKIFPLISGIKEEIELLEQKETILFEQITTAIARNEKMKNAVQKLEQTALLSNRFIESVDSDDLNLNMIEAEKSITRARILMNHVLPNKFEEKK